MGRHRIIRTDTADAGLRKIILYVAANFGNAVALEKLKKLEQSQGYKVFVLEKDLVFYKINESPKEIVIYAIVDQRQDYLNIIRGL